MRHHAWWRGAAALAVGLTSVPLCAQNPPATAGRVVLEARGNEPSWALTVTPETLTLRGMMLAEPITAATPQPTQAPDGATVYAIAGAKPLTVRVVERICTDPMTGMPFPRQVSVAVDGRTLTGCGGTTAEALRGSWTVTAINGKAPIATAEPTLDFADEGRLSGKGSCNRFVTGVTITGESLTITQAATTMMACPQPIMDQEALFLAVLSGVVRCAIAADGTLTLHAGDGRTLTARRTP
jgi:heat shock protein HslJ